jgi:hypothetical protein
VTHISMRQAPDERLLLAEAVRTVVLHQLQVTQSQEDAQGWAETLEFEVAGGGQLWWVSADMCSLINTAVETMPAYPLHSEDIPSHAGVVFFETPLKGFELFEIISSRQVSAIIWFPTNYKQPGKAISVASWSRSDLNWAYMDLAKWDVGKTCDTSVADPLAVLWALSSQTLATNTTVELDRPQRRRAARAGLPTAPFRVVYLRRLAKEGHGSKHDAEFSHRWVVSGHWRQQPCGPGRTQRRPTWVAPHIKGPADKPLVLKETIKALVR